jgi:2-amino-4-hydroxy-6-hydroxymethyldihydropteridine diphosphokinase
MPEVWVGVGSNTDTTTALRGAVAALEGRFGRVACSPVYRSASVGVSAPDYLNMVVSFFTDLGVEALRSVLARIETDAGRSRTDPAICRLDLDLLVFGCRVDAANRLPRPGAFTLPFVRAPLAALAPGLVHPLTGERCGTVQPPADGTLENLGWLT